MVKKSFPVYEIGPGTFIGEEILFNQSNLYEYTVTVDSQTARLYVFEKNPNNKDFTTVALF